MDTIDLRSDTVSWPTPTMREAMANAVVGDDVFGDDPTVNQLEAESAELLGKEAGLFVASGTMGNITSLLTHCGRGDEVILGKQTHTFNMEVGGIAAFGSIMPNPVPVQADGTLDLDDIRHAIRGENVHLTDTRLIALENTFNGIPLTVEYTQSVAEIARENGLKLHIDGARIFNAAAALNVPAKELVAEADSATFCLSKGLCAPAGSIIVGSKAFIDEARRNRKRLGGGMRQAGILAAAGLISIREMIHRLGDDHANARLLADALATIPCVEIDTDTVKSNMIFFALTDDAPITADAFVTKLKDDYNIHILSPSGRRFRFVTHYWITRERTEQVIEAIQTLLT